MNWRTKRLNNSTKYPLHALTVHHFKEEMKSVGELSNTCSQIVLKCLHLARIGRPDILWSVNRLARSITKWAKACDKRLIRLISCIHHIHVNANCHVGNAAKQCRLGLFQDSNIVRFWKSFVYSNRLDVQETIINLTIQLYLKLSAALGRDRRARASQEESSPLATCRCHGRKHTQLTGWEALCGGCDSHAGWRSAAGVARRTGGLAPRGWCPTICALLPPSGSSHERSPLTRWVPKTVIPLGCQTSGPKSSTLVGCSGDLFHTRVFPWCNLMPATLNNASPNRSYKKRTRPGWHTMYTSSRKAHNCSPASNSVETSSIAP